MVVRLLLMLLLLLMLMLMLMLLLMLILLLLRPRLLHKCRAQRVCVQLPLRRQRRPLRQLPMQSRCRKNKAPQWQASRATHFARLLAGGGG